MNDKVLVKQLLLTENFWILSKPLVKMYGIETAFVISALSEAEKMFADKNGWFFQTKDTLEEFTGLSRYKQDQAIDQLIEAKVLKKDVRGIPAKRYFKFDYKELSNQFVKVLHTTTEKIDGQEPEKLATNKESNIKKIDKESNKYVAENEEPEPEPKPEPKKKKSRENKFSDEQLALAKLLRREVKKNFPKSREPNIESWADHIRLMMERDKRTAEEVKSAIIWSQNDDFWYSNILSASKLRKQFDKLNAAADREGNSFTKDPSEENTMESWLAPSKDDRDWSGGWLD